ncbi:MULTISPECIES: hypothetical protein [Alphaproteobacteria]|uniref:Uncharacterized protein n=2 Tax=Alphaproteobacteria TaxID=28211 RepID=A0A512HD94_9HYPH|nr:MULTISPECIES: hypothetical protein [Alphaproteobacteria]GEO83419.1 hypothetical protein RNA01_03510 [Ciceribacter naphthalenivorans]GLR23008.1 hypothetical protein GCM10007920_27960 [Ciceribacter naphthalenivorans]GLT05864.1 hypothetical protein GCM10007926_27960 [Sphingomonas psychrolutea]
MPLAPIATCPHTRSDARADNGTDNRSDTTQGARNDADKDVTSAAGADAAVGAAAESEKEAGRDDGLARLLLMRYTAEMLAMPHHVCTYRNCRRGLACRWIDTDNDAPSCLVLLDPAERQVYDALAGVVLGAARLGPKVEPGSGPEAWELWSAGLEIILVYLRKMPRRRHRPRGRPKGGHRAGAHPRGELP